MEMNFTFEDMHEEEPPEPMGSFIRYSSPWDNPRERRLMLLEFRAQALQREIHERYAPLRPSPLRNEIDPADLPDPEASNAETMDAKPTDVEPTDDAQRELPCLFDSADLDSDGSDSSSRSGSSSDPPVYSDEPDGRECRRRRMAGDDGPEEERREVTSPITSSDPE
ncbi:hypothetical protein B0I37DRAFT_421436 [Chaetomium sp. MPI-CAGE-AT-0009]|nr:hypothetical protein B0I37DRAFT_421436 [Chaetomium sp. MPI-CAGE-AT-0009]